MGDRRRLRRTARRVSRLFRFRLYLHLRFLGRGQPCSGLSARRRPNRDGVRRSNFAEKRRPQRADSLGRLRGRSRLLLFLARKRFRGVLFRLPNLPKLRVITKRVSPLIAPPNFAALRNVRERPRRDKTPFAFEQPLFKRYSNATTTYLKTLKSKIVPFKTRRRFFGKLRPTSVCATTIEKTSRVY